MSKFGRKPIYCESNVKVEVVNNNISYKGKESSGNYSVSDDFIVKFDENKIIISPSEKVKLKKKDLNRLWGMHRAILGNLLSGASKLFEKKMKIEGLGFKVVKVSESILNFFLGFSHKIEYILPKSVSIEVDKTGQVFVLRSFDKELLGLVASNIRKFKEPEPYKGKGICYHDEKILRKEGKKK